VVQERELRDADFSEAARGVRNSEEAADDDAAEGSVLSAEEQKAFREAERKLQKLRKGAGAKIAKLEASIAEAEEAIEALEEEMVSAGADVGKLTELGEARDARQAKVDAWYAEWEELEELLADE